jgi:glycolate oxidase FAD binding subunit
VAPPIAPDVATLAELAKACDDHVRPASEDDHVGGVTPRFVASPASTAETAEVLRVAAQHDLYVVARGAGTKLGWGATPTSVDLVIDMTRCSGVIEHAAGDLVVLVRAGTPLEELQSVLAAADQELVFDNPLPGATVGGSLAIAPSGPRRLLRGTLRDLLIGVTFVRSDGVVAKAGGRVVKNVAGYDFGKLLTGSYGTLGLITEAVFRLHPRPTARQVVSARGSDAAAVARAAHAVVASQTVPSAVEIDWPGERGSGPTVSVLLEGTQEGVAARSETVRLLLDTALADSHLADSPLADPGSPDWWGRYPFGPHDVGLKLTCAVSALADLLDAARGAAARHGAALHLRGSAAGVLHAGLPGDTPANVVSSVLDDLRGAAASYAGSVVVLTAPPATRDAVDVWGPVPGLALMRRLKDELDPPHRFSPGRFVGGI